MSAQEEENQRIIPTSELDAFMITTETAWGKNEIPRELREQLNKYYVTINPETNEKGIRISGLWSLLAYYTRDMRLGNISRHNGEYEYCLYYLDLAGDYLHMNEYRPFVICLSRVVKHLELSQSRGGFFRKQANKFTHETIKQELEPPKRSLWGSNKKRGGET